MLSFLIALLLWWEWFFGVIACRKSAILPPMKICLETYKRLPGPLPSVYLPSGLKMDHETDFPFSSLVRDRLRFPSFKLLLSH